MSIYQNILIGFCRFIILKVKVRKIFLVVLWGSFFSLGNFSLWSLDIVDVHDPIYRDIDVWARAGLIKNPPYLRPYPVSVLRALLKQVINSTHAHEIGKASRYLEQLDFWYNLSFGTSVTGRVQVPAALANNVLYGDFFIDFLLNFNWQDIISTSFSIYPSIVYRPNKALLGGDGFATSSDFHVVNGFYNMPFGRSYDRMIPFEDAIGAFNLAGLEIRQIFRSITSVGFVYDNVHTFAPWDKAGEKAPLNTDPSLLGFYVTAGISRLSYGPLHNNGVFFGGSSPEMPNFSLIWQPVRWFALDFNYSILSASEDRPSAQFANDKHVVFHSARFKPFDWWEFSINEAIVYGERFDLIYFIPLSYFFYSQGLNGYSDNSLIGLSNTFRLPYSIQLDIALNVDDVGFAQLIRFEPFRIKYAVQASVSWTPLQRWLRFAELDYTAVSPFMYTHVRGDWTGPTEDDRQFVYNSYTNKGFSLGPSLDPNSDRLRLHLQFEPFPHKHTFLVDLVGTFIRHADPNEGRPDLQADNDALGILGGSLFDAGIHFQGDEQDGSMLYGAHSLLSSPTKTYVMQWELELSYRLLLGGNDLFLVLNYLFEYIWNQDLIVGQNVYHHYLFARIGYRYHF